MLSVLLSLSRIRRLYTPHVVLPFIKPWYRHVRWLYQPSAILGFVLILILEPRLTVASILLMYYHVKLTFHYGQCDMNKPYAILKALGQPVRGTETGLKRHQSAGKDSAYYFSVVYNPRCPQSDAVNKLCFRKSYYRFPSELCCDKAQHSLLTPARVGIFSKRREATTTSGTKKPFGLLSFLLQRACGVELGIQPHDPRAVLPRCTLPRCESRV